MKAVLPSRILIMSDFHDVLFPPDISYGSSGGPKFKTAIWDAPSGFDVRVDMWPETRAEYDVSHGIKSEAQAEALTAFFMCRRGRAFGFRFKDFNDYKLENVTLGQGDYATSVFQLRKEYRSPRPGGEDYVTQRVLNKIEAGTDKGVQIDGVTLPKTPGSPRYYSLDYTTGKLKLNTPMWGGRYAGMTPQTGINWRTNELPPNYDTYVPGSVTGAVLFYASKIGRAFVRGGKFAVLGMPGLIRLNLETAQADAQASSAGMGVPGGNIDHIGAVSPSGMLYVTRSGSNTTLMHKIDGLTMQYVSSWGEEGIWPNDERGVGAPWSPGCVSHDEQYLLWPDLWGNVDIHSAETMQRVARIGRFGGITSQQYVGATPYKESGFAFVYERPSAENGCGLRIWLNGASWIAAAWGAPTARPVGCYYDKKTDGVLVFWSHEEAPENAPNSAYGYDHWAGLYLPEEGRWAWTRRMPPHMRTVYARSNCQTVLDGEFFWVRNAGSPWGKRMWRIETETGVLESRPAASAGDYQVYDPQRKIIGQVGGYVQLDPPNVTSTDLAYVAYTPPEKLTLGSVEFHIGVRFDTDHLNMKHEFWTYRSWESIPLVEVRDWTELELD